MAARSPAPLARQPMAGNGGRSAPAAALLRLLPRPALRRALLRAAPVAALARGRPGGVLNDLSQQLDQGLNFSIINSLRTGNMLIDMLVCMLVPVLIRYLLLGDFASLLQRLVFPLEGVLWRKPYVRVIEYVDGGNHRLRRMPLEDMQSVIENTDRNNILQKAIRLYIAEKYSINDLNMETNLVSMKKIQTEQKNNEFGVRASTFSGSYQQLTSFAVHMLPKKGQWTLIDRERDISFKQVVNEQQLGSEQNSMTQTVTVVSISGRSPEAVNGWIVEAFEWYKEKRKADQDKSRFFYLALPSDGKDDKSGKPKCIFKQYLLSDTKTFRSLFFPEKEGLLLLIDDFLRKRGKFAIEGFPDKLGLLLDGPPGTGKTSLIKALAHYTDRHVVSVNLARIKTNQDLMDLLFDLVFPVQGGDLPVKMQFQDVIFVMEDVDAASKVVYARAGDKRKGAARAKKKPAAASSGQANGAAPCADVAPCGAASASSGAPGAPGGGATREGAAEEAAASGGAAAQPAGAAAAGGADGGAGGAGGAGAAQAAEVDGAGVADGADGGRCPPPTMPALLRMISAKSDMAEDAAAPPPEAGEAAEGEPEPAGPAEPAGDSDAGDGESPDRKPRVRSDGNVMRELLYTMMAATGDGSASGSEEARPTPFKSRFSFEGEDELNLAGLLNVLDGVVDSPGRIVVMTTNHPDKLDPALIRPGRINKRIHLGYVQATSLCQMAQHYMQVQLTDGERSQLERLASTRTVTPAQVEQCCAESADVSGLLSILRDMQ